MTTQLLLFPASGYHTPCDLEGAVFEGDNQTMTVAAAAAFMRQAAALAAVGVTLTVPGTVLSTWLGVALHSALEVTRDDDTLRYEHSRAIFWHTDGEQDGLLCDLLDMAHPGEVVFFARNSGGNIADALDAYATNPRAAERKYGVQAALDALTLRNPADKLVTLVRMINAVCRVDASVVDLDGNEVSQ